MGISIDAGKCTGCINCELACSFTKANIFNPKKSRIQVIPLDYLGFSNPVVCLLCKNPKCVAACPAGALSQTEVGTINLEEEKCDGCRICVEECIVGAINFDEESGLPLICDLCGGEPACVEWCPADALTTNSDKWGKGSEEITDTAGKAKPFKKNTGSSQKRKGRKEITYTAGKAKPLMKKWGIPESALDWYKKFA